MGAGDVTHAIIQTRDGTASINSQIAALRNTANDKWLVVNTAPGEFVVINVEES